MNTFFDNVAKSRSKSLFLVVEPCEVKKEDAPVETPKVAPTPPVPPAQVIPPAPTPRPVPKESFQDSTSYLVLLGGVTGLLVLIVVVLVVVFVVRRSK